MDKILKDSYENIFNLLHGAEIETRKLGASYLINNLVPLEDFANYVYNKFINAPLIRRVKRSESEDGYYIDPRAIRREYLTSVFLTLTYDERINSTDLFLEQGLLCYYIQASFSFRYYGRLDNYIVSYNSQFIFDDTYLSDLKDFSRFVTQELKLLIFEMVEDIATEDYKTLGVADYFGINK